MNSKAQKTLNKIYQTPVLKTIEYKSVEHLIISLGGKVISGAGSRVRFELKGDSLNIHTPHPQKELKPYVVRLLREFLKDKI